MLCVMTSMLPERLSRARPIFAGISLRTPLYRKNLKNRFLAASGLPQNLHSHSGLASRQWSLAPNANFEDPPCQIPDSSSYFGIPQNLHSHSGLASWQWSLAPNANFEDPPPVRPPRVK